MLLRRITEHVKTQNWVAVILDFVIVVFGVFVGIQAQAWNSARLDRSIEREYLERIHGEVSEMIQRDNEGVEWDRSRLKLLEEVALYLLGSDQQTTLTNDHCVAITQSHIYAARIATPSAMEELLATGRILLVSNDKIRSKIVNFTQSVVGFQQFRADIQAARTVLTSRFPALISAGLQSNSAECAFDSMKMRPEFINHFMHNVFRRRAYTRRVVLGMQTLQIELRQTLEQELKRSH